MLSGAIREFRSLPSPWLLNRLGGTSRRANSFLLRSGTTPIWLLLPWPGIMKYSHSTVDSFNTRTFPLSSCRKSSIRVALLMPGPPCRTVLRSGPIGRAQQRFKIRQPPATILALQPGETSRHLRGDFRRVRVVRVPVERLVDWRAMS